MGMYLVGGDSFHRQSGLVGISARAREEIRHEECWLRLHGCVTNRDAGPLQPEQAGQDARASGQEQCNRCSR